MFKMIGADQKEYGPVSADQVRQWIGEGRANGQTLAQADGSTDWRPLSAFPDFAEALKSSVASMPPLIPPPSVAWTGLTADMVGMDFSLDVGACLARSWQLVRTQLGLLIAAVAIVMVILVGIDLVPILGGLISVVIYGPLVAGLCLLFIKLIREEPASLQDVFAGFSEFFVPLMLGGMVMSIMTLAGGILFLVAWFFHRFIPAPMVVLMAVAGIVPMIYLRVSWIFTLPLMIDKHLEFWPAMELSRKTVSRHWWPVFGLLLVAGLIACIGFAFCLVGGLVTLPIFYGALMYAYEDIFGAASEPAA
jgi:hypothetical protein